MGKENRLNETRVMNCGQKATIINYRNYHDMDIQFEDGTIVEHCSYGNYKRGGVFNPELRKIKDYTYFLENHMLYKTTIYKVGDGVAVTERRG